jgi:hypothetical protein
MTLLLVCLGAVVHGQTTCAGPRNLDELRSHLWGPSSNYSAETRPGFAIHGHAAPPDVIAVQLQLFSLVEVDSKQQTFTVDVYVRTVWQDPRLAYLNTSAGACFTGNDDVNYLAHRTLFLPGVSDRARIWTPDVSFNNLAKPEQVVNGAVWLNHTGRVWWTRRTQLTFFCRMDYTRLPYDTQFCPVTFISFRESSAEATLVFKDNAPVRTTVGAADRGTMEWRLVEANGRAKDQSRTGGMGANGEEIVEIVFQLRRESAYYEKYVLLPSVLFVTIGWSTFFIEVSSQENKLPLSLTATY